MSDTFDKSSTLKIDGEVLNRSSFKKTDGDKLARRVSNEAEDPLHVQTKALVQGVDYDLITATYPNTTTEVYTYTLATVPVLTATVVYTAANKRDISTVSFV